MRRTYPIVLCDDGEIFENGDQHLLVIIPDWDLVTQGKNLTDAIDMAYDIIGVHGAYWEDDGHTEPKPTPSDYKAVAEKYPKHMVAMVNIDFEEYRQANDSRTVNKHCTLPSWLAVKAERAELNFSTVLQEALKRELGL